MDVLHRHSTTNSRSAEKHENTKKQLSLKSSFRAAIAVADCRHIVFVVIGPSFFDCRLYLPPRRFRTSSFSVLISLSLSYLCSPLLQCRDREQESSLSPPFCRRCRHQPCRSPRRHIRHTVTVAVPTPTALRQTRSAHGPVPVHLAMSRPPARIRSGQM